MPEERLFPLPAEKRCSTCKAVKPLTEFNRRSTAPDGRQWSCRDCNKRYHYENWDRHMEQIRRRNRERIARSKQAVLDHLREHPCVDCGETDVVVLEFDHVGHKKANISLLMKSAETKRVLEEIEQCEVRCANCHRRVTAERGGWWRTKL